MPISINGSGTVTGISAGGLPDACITADDLADGAAATAKIPDNAITAPKLDGSQSGSAPIYAARAWVNFNGTGTVAIRASGNVSSITDNNTGNYTVNFATALSSSNYAVVSSTGSNSSSAVQYNFAVLQSSVTAGPTNKTTSAVQLIIGLTSLIDTAELSVAVFG
jgi:hypothetical protein